VYKNVWNISDVAEAIAKPC